MAESNAVRLWALRMAGVALLATSGWLIYNSVSDGRKQNVWEGLRPLPAQNFYSTEARFTSGSAPHAPADFKNQISVVAFVYLKCPTFCPKIMTEMKKLHTELGPDAEKVNFLVFTFDDNTDRPADLAEFRKRYQLQGNTWKVLTGKDAEFRKIAQIFDLKYSVVRGEKVNYIHTNLIALVQKDGKVFAADYGLQKGAAALARRIQTEL